MKLARMTHEETSLAVRERLPLIIPLGALEQHGPHLPLITDTLIAEDLATRVADAVPAVVAPALCYTSHSRPRSGGGRTFSGSVGLPASLFSAVVYELVREFLRQGFRKVVLLNAHLENTDPAFEALERLLGPGGEYREVAADATVLLINSWEMLDAVDIAKVAEALGTEVNWPAEHAGVLETSVMEHVARELVRSDLKVKGGAPRTLPYDSFPTNPDTVWTNGIGTTAEPASRELGKMLVESRVAHIIDVLRSEFGDQSG
jgi:creatinine amidohydrolase